MLALCVVVSTAAFGVSSAANATKRENADYWILAAAINSRYACAMGYHFSYYQVEQLNGKVPADPKRPADLWTTKGAHAVSFDIGNSYQRATPW
jgi:hypothetical protein